MLRTVWYLIRGFVAAWLASVAVSVAAAPVQTGQWVHALAMFKPPKYPADFTHFEYVNPNAPKGGTLRLGNPDRRTSFDKLNPYTIRGVAPAALDIFMFERLCAFSMDEPSTMYGLLAEAMFVAPDLSSISFRLHPKARFSNGDPVTPEDVVDSHKRLTGKLVLPSLVNAANVASQAVVVDARTVRFDLRQRNAGALFTLGYLPIFSRKWGNGKPLSEIVNEPPITSGPYVIDKIEMPSRIELKRNPDYWARDLPVRRGHFNFDRITYRLYKDLDVRREAFKAGEFDLFREFSSSKFARMHQGRKWADGRIIKKTWIVDTGSMQQAINLNMRRPKFQDIRVRQALSLAWDFEHYNRYGYFLRANSVFNNTPFAAEGPPSPAELALLEPFRDQLPKAVFGEPFRAPRNDTHPNALRENLKRAAALLAEAGWKVGPDGKLRNAKGEEFVIEYLDPNRSGNFVDFERNLKRLGIQFKERVVDFSLYRTRLENFDYDMIVIVEGKFTLPDAETLRSLWHSEGVNRPGSNNFRGVSSPALDALIERIRTANTYDELLAAARAFDRVAMWSHFQIPMLYTRGENTSYWNKFGIPAVQARYFQFDSMPDSNSQPWPLWTWWDRSLEGRGTTTSAPSATPNPR